MDELLGEFLTETNEGLDQLDVELVRFERGVAALELEVSSGTYVRSIADALGGHCVTLRRTAIGPFAVEEADPDRVLPVTDALARLA